MRDPETPKEWQAAIDAADYLLILDSLRQYGLIAGGPQIAVDRCADLLRRGADRGVFPTPPDRRRAGIAAWLCGERAALGVPQRRIAQQAGLSDMRISLIARGRVDCNDATLARIRAALASIRNERGAGA